MTSVRRNIPTPAAIWALIAAACLAGCGAPQTRPAPPAWVAPQIRQHVDTLLCQLPSPCKYFSIHLIDVDQPIAEIDFSRRIVVSRGMLQLVNTEAELMFVLAHELAHHELSHRAPRDAAKRLPIELAADAQAQRVLCDMGLSGEAARNLLTRLQESDRAIVEHKLKELAQKEVSARLAALTACLNPGQQSRLLSPAQFRALMRSENPAPKTTPSPPKD